MNERWHCGIDLLALLGLALAPDGSTVAVGGWSEDNDIYLFDRASGRLLDAASGAEAGRDADYVEKALPRITRKWGYEQFPFSGTEGSSFTLASISTQLS